MARISGDDGARPRQGFPFGRPAVGLDRAYRVELTGPGIPTVRQCHLLPSRGVAIRPGATGHRGRAELSGTSLCSTDSTFRRIRPLGSPGRWSSFITTETRGATWAIVSTHVLMTAMISSHSPSTLVNMALVSLGRPLARTMRTVSATRSPTDSPVPSGVMENAASMPSIVSPEDPGRQRPPTMMSAPGPGGRSRGVEASIWAASASGPQRSPANRRWWLARPTPRSAASGVGRRGRARPTGSGPLAKHGRYGSSSTGGLRHDPLVTPRGGECHRRIAADHAEDAPNGRLLRPNESTHRRVNGAGSRIDISTGVVFVVVMADLAWGISSENVIHSGRAAGRELRNCQSADGFVDVKGSD